MYTIDIQELIDYSKCPMYYFLKYKAKDVKTEHINLIEKYDEDIHKVIYFAFSRVREGKGIDIKDIKSSWGRAWIKDKRKANIMFSESLMTKDTYNEKRRRGIESLIKFHKQFSLNPGYPIAINSDYKLQINKFLTITGKFEILRENDDKDIELISFKTDEHTNNRVVKEYDLKLTASSLALSDYIDGKHLKHSMYHVDKGVMYKTNADINKEFFKYNIINIFKCIHNKIYYMRADNSCYNCQYKDICTNKSKMAQILDKEGIKC